jgi:hypothetical protein
VDAQKRLEMIEALLVEVTQHLDVVGHALAAHAVAREESPRSVEGMPRSPEQYNLQAEQEWWEKAQQGLTLVKQAFTHLAQAEQQRGVVTKSAGA